jgi:hypothetical protein
MKKIHYSFKNGFSKLKNEDVAIVRQLTWEAIGCKTIEEYYRKRNDFTNIPYHLFVDITKIFVRFGVSKNQIWSVRYDENKDE